MSSILDDPVSLLNNGTFGGGAPQANPEDPLRAALARHIASMPAQRQITPEEIFGALTKYLQASRNNRLTMDGYTQPATQSDADAEDSHHWANLQEEANPVNRIAREKAMNPGDSRPSFTEQELAARQMTPQQHIDQAMGAGWASMSPAQRRAVLQAKIGQPIDNIDPTTGVQVGGAQSPNMYSMF